MHSLKTKQTPGRPEKYKQLRDIIITDIFSSKLKPGEFYATEQNLCDRFGAGRNTIRKALTEVGKAGFIVRRKRVGILAGTQLDHHDYSDLSALVPSKVVLLMPYWDNIAGGFYSNQVLQGLRSSEKKKKWIIDTRLHNDSLDHIGPDTEAVIAVSPSLAMCIQLQILSEKGIRIIIIEPSLPYQIDFAISIRPAIYKASIAIVKELYELGHRKIGIMNCLLGHDTFSQWQLGYLSAHHELQLPVHPNAMIFVENNKILQSIDIKNISAWICTSQGVMDLFTSAFSRNHLNIPEDISVVGSDDPGDIIIPSLGTSLSVVRPDYSRLVRIIRQILQNQTKFAPGDIIDLPTVSISRGSVGPKK